jgi:hypothetical protein
MLTQLGSSFLFRRPSAKFTLALLTATVVVTLAAFTAQAWRERAGSSIKQEAAAQPTPSPEGYVRRARLGPRLRDVLNVIGDRVERPGKERVVLIGTVRRQGSQQASPLRLILELPGLMRFEEGAESLMVAINAATIGPRLNDGIFTPPPGQ